MNKGELIAAVADDTALTRRQVDQALSQALTKIKDAVASGNKVALHDFGSFVPVQRAARPGRDIRTGKPFLIPAKTAVGFRPAKAFKKAVDP